uniref:DNA mismatch repair protein Mlh1 C-terminal domain-containing protein n=1 Tax=Rhizophora mucronata TaxID=61149 RepID=A0A2P2LUQ2_RHIMU
MYQQVLRRFAHFTAIQLSEPAPLPELIMLALKEEDLYSDSNENDDLKEKIAEVGLILWTHDFNFYLGITFSNPHSLEHYEISF